MRLRGDVRFENVTFSYDGEKTVLDDVSFYAKPGQKIALVGSTGAGKTTITNLLNRFYDISQGRIVYDGIPVDRIRKDDLRRSLSMVLQDTHLFTGTVMENIRYGNKSASDEEVIRAAKLANAHGFIKHLPEGYDTVLTADGANLSQGQRQLLAIARAAVADPPVLILDEATSSIDTRTEALIEKGMDRLMECRTVFVIAHRFPPSEAMPYWCWRTAGSLRGATMTTAAQKASTTNCIQACSNCNTTTGTTNHGEDTLAAFAPRTEPLAALNPWTDPLVQIN